MQPLLNKILKFGLRRFNGYSALSGQSEMIAVERHGQFHPTANGRISTASVIAGGWRAVEDGLDEAGETFGGSWRERLSWECPLLA